MRSSTVFEGTQFIANLSSSGTLLVPGSGAEKIMVTKARMAIVWILDFKYFLENANSDCRLG